MRGARAVDVGASTGGFTEALLAHGAASVLAVDVGHGQLHPTLRRRPARDVARGGRLAEAVARRGRGAVRLLHRRRQLRRRAQHAARPGVPAAAWRPGRRAGQAAVRAARTGRSKAGHVEDPQPAARGAGEGSGARRGARIQAGGGDRLARGRRRGASIEILAHLVFSGRPTSLPAPGERRRDERHPKRKARARAAAASLRWFAVVAPGLEEAAAREIAALPDAADAAPRSRRRRVERAGRSAATARTSGCALPTRVLARVGTVESREFGKLRRRAAGLDWGAFVAPGASLSLRASASRSRLYHTGAIVETAALAIGDAVKGARVAKNDEAADVVDPGARPRGRVHLQRRRLRASGCIGAARASRSAPAPLRETLAAGLLALAGWDPSVPLRRSDVRRRARSSSRRRCRRSTGRPGSTGRSGRIRHRRLAALLGAARPRRRRRPCATRRAGAIRAARPAPIAGVRAARRARHRERAAQRRSGRGLARR